MDLKAVLDEVGAWAAEQRLRLVEELWGGLCAASDMAEVHDELKTLLDHRIESLDQRLGEIAARGKSAKLGRDEG
jgi:hypothetical protein